MKNENREHKKNVNRNKIGNQKWKQKKINNRNKK